jgi:hypothetical protein
MAVSKVLSLGGEVAKSAHLLTKKGSCRLMPAPTRSVSHMLMIELEAAGEGSFARH